MLEELYHNFWLFVYVYSEYKSEWIDAGLPQPSLYVPKKYGYYLGYILEGYFGTKKNRKLLADAAVRLQKTLLKEGALKTEILPYRPYLEHLPDYAVLENKIYNLRDDILPHCVSLRERKITQEDKVLKLFAEYDQKSTEDKLFDSIRFSVYDFVKANGKSALTLDYVMQIAEVKYELIGGKGESTARSKAKAIYEWVMENYNPGGKNNWNYKRKTKDNKELKMTRAQRALENAKMIKQKKREAILNLINSDIANEFKKKNGKWNIKKIAEALGFKRETVSKHLKELNIT